MRRRGLKKVFLGSMFFFILLDILSVQAYVNIDFPIWLAVIIIVGAIIVVLVILRGIGGIYIDRKERKIEKEIEELEEQIEYL
jgi:hypothetical protein